MEGTSDKEQEQEQEQEYSTLAEMAKASGLSLDTVLSHRRAGSFPSRKKGMRWIVPYAEAIKFIRLAKCGELPGVWEAVQKRCSCEELPKGVTFVSLWKVTNILGIGNGAVLQRISDGKIKAWWSQDRWWIPEAELSKLKAERRECLAEEEAVMLGTKKRWFYTLPELGAKAWLSEGKIRDQLKAGSFAAIKSTKGWLVPNSSAEAFIRLAKSGKLPGIWEKTQKAFQCEERPSDVMTYPLQSIAQQLRVSNRAILERIRSGEVEAYYVKSEWWVSEFIGDKQRKGKKQALEVSIARPCFFADKALRDYFMSCEHLEFLNCGVLTVEGLADLLSEKNAKEFFFGKQSRMQNGAHPLDVQRLCGNVRFTEI